MGIMQLDEFVQGNARFQEASDETFAAVSGGTGRINLAEAWEAVEHIYLKIDKPLIEMGLLAHKLTPKEVQTLFEEADVSHRQTLDRVEFQDFFAKVVTKAGVKAVKGASQKYGMAMAGGIIAVFLTKRLLRRLPVVGLLVKPLLVLVPTALVGPVLGVVAIRTAATTDFGALRRLRRWRPNWGGKKKAAAHSDPMLLEAAPAPLLLTDRRGAAKAAAAAAEHRRNSGRDGAPPAPAAAPSQGEQGGASTPAPAEPAAAAAPLKAGYPTAGDAGPPAGPVTSAGENSASAAAAPATAARGAEGSEQDNWRSGASGSAAAGRRVIIEEVPADEETLQGGRDGSVGAGGGGGAADGGGNGGSAALSGKEASYAAALAHCGVHAPPSAAEVRAAQADGAGRGGGGGGNGSRDGVAADDMAARSVKA